MPLSIATNLASMTAQRSFLNSNSDLETAFERLSTGKRVNSASDDAAGLAIGKDLESRVRGLNQAIRNVNDGISMVQIAEGAMDEATTILQRMRDLAVQAANDSLSTVERSYLNTEHSKLATTLGAVFDQAKFNDTDLIGDSSPTNVTIQSGADAGDTTSISIAAMSESVLEVAASNIDLTNATSRVEKVTFDTTGLSTASTKTISLSFDGKTFDALMNNTNNLAEVVSDLNTALSNQGINASFGAPSGNNLTLTFTDKGQHSAYSMTDGTTTLASSAITIASGEDGIDTASSAISSIDRALNTIASQRAELGAFQQQLESTVRNLANVAENTSAAQGRIMDTDYAAETANLTKAQILQQAATSILAQANAQPQGVLSLLQ
jgi:flagellin